MQRAFHIHQVPVGDELPDEMYMAKQAKIDAATAATHAIVSAVPGRKIRVTAIMLRAAGTVTITWKSASTGISGADALKEGYGISDNWAPYGFFYETVAGEALNLTLSDAVQVTGTINYIEV